MRKARLATGSQASTFYSADFVQCDERIHFNPLFIHEDQKDSVNFRNPLFLHFDLEFMVNVFANVAKGLEMVDVLESDFRR
jgi:hypothetical protein